jgi:nicotinamide-nucleotide amidase
MAQGALERCPSASLAVAITCVGGPEPDEDGNPAGLTYIAVQCRGGPPRIRQLTIDASTAGRIRGQVLAEALRLMREPIGND